MANIVEDTRNAATENLTAIITKKNAWVKPGPSMEGDDAMPRLKRGTTVRIIGEAVDDYAYTWIPIEHEGVKGYILAEYIRIQTKK